MSIGRRMLSNDDFVALQDNINMVELIQILDDILYLGMAIPFVIEAKVLCLIVLKLHLQVVVCGDFRHHLAERNIHERFVNGWLLRIFGS